MATSSDKNGYSTFEQESQQIMPEQEKNNGLQIKHLKTIIYVLLSLIVILLIFSIIVTVNIYKNNSDMRKKKDAIPVHLVSGLDTYLKAHCILHEDTLEPEGMDLNGEGMTVIRNPIEISSPINIAYSPLVNNLTGEIEYFSTLDPAGNAVAKPKCQTDFDTSTYTMKNNAYAFDVHTCEFPLPSWMNETDIINLPRRYSPVTHRITLTSVEVVAELEEGHTFEFFTYNATVPGPPLRVREGDWIDLTLINPNTSLHEHSVDFHSMTGLDGGAASLRVNPGERARTVWQAIIPGMFIYHCASGWASDHISKGMYGAIIVEPYYGLPYSDMDVYIGQGELYLHYPLVNNMGTKFERPTPNLHNTFDTIKERYEMSDVVMMNGAPFALLHNPIITTVGSIVRAFIVSGGPNHLSSFHLIGDSFDRVWLHGDFAKSPQQNIQTTTVPPGGCAVADWRHDTPGAFTLVDHALTRAFVRGNLGIIRSCLPSDVGCLSGEKKANYAARYTCNTDRYDDINETYFGNNDCVFCPWSRDEFKYSTVYEETDEIYDYLDAESVCNISDRITIWQGNESLHNDTVSDIRNKWRKNRYPGEKQWSLSSRLRTADPMIGNKRSGPGGDDDEDFDPSTCIVNVGQEIMGAIEIEYSMEKNGKGEIEISSLYSNMIDGGWISFGRGGDGISTMTGSHVHTVLFNSDLSDIEFVAHFLRDYGTPVLDDSDDKFPISGPSVSVTGGLVRYSFNVLAGDWIDPPSQNSVPMVVAIGQLRDGKVETADMIKHFNKDIVYADLTAQRCLLGGTKV